MGSSECIIYYSGKWVIRVFGVRINDIRGMRAFEELIL